MFREVNLLIFPPRSFFGHAVFCLTCLQFWSPGIQAGTSWTFLFFYIVPGVTHSAGSWAGLEGPQRHRSDVSVTRQMHPLTLHPPHGSLELTKGREQEFGWWDALKQVVCQILACSQWEFWAVMELPLISFLSPILLSQDSLLPQEIIIKVEREDSGPMAVPSQVSWTHGLFTLRNVCGWLVAEARLKWTGKWVESDGNGGKYIETWWSCERLKRVIAVRTFEVEGLF